jgi:hypothetical protein
MVFSILGDLGFPYRLPAIAACFINNFTSYMDLQTGIQIQSQGKHAALRKK